MKDINLYDFFPFTQIRDVQKELIEDIDRVISDRSHLIAHAPTGLGKTAAALVPAVAHSLFDKKTIFFLTPKNLQHRIAIETLKEINKKIKKIKKFNENLVVADVMGKGEMCIGAQSDEEVRGVYDYCSRMRKNYREIVDSGAGDLRTCPYYKRVYQGGTFKFSGDFREILNYLKKNITHNREIIDMCAKKEICPYCMVEALSKDAKVIIGNYYHVFAPPERAFTKKLSDAIWSEGAIIIIDEAHNFPENIKKQLSSTLTQFALERALGEIGALIERYEGINLSGSDSKSIEDAKKFTARLKKLENNIRKFIGIFVQMGKQIKLGFEQEKYAGIERDDFIRLIEQICDYDDLVFELSNTAEIYKNSFTKYRSSVEYLSSFLDMWQTTEGAHIKSVKKYNRRGVHEVAIQNDCIDPSVASRDIIEMSHTTILMSGTLVPQKMYEHLLGMSEKRTHKKEYISPFPVENREIFIIRGMSAMYKNRNQSMYEKYAREIVKVSCSAPGNIAVFFPSYSFRDKVFGLINQKSFGKHCFEKQKFRGVLNKRLILEQQNMENRYREIIIRELMSAKKENGALFMGVQGGSFSEGIDYPDQLLDVVIIAGLAVARPDFRAIKMIAYYTEQFLEDGSNYVYTFPAINKMVQSAGRLIRSQKDRGCIVIMDDRLMWDNYRKYLPREWNYHIILDPAEPVFNFFKNFKSKNSKDKSVNKQVDKKQ